MTIAAPEHKTESWKNLDWHLLSPAESTRQLRSNTESGLSSAEVRRRLSKFGRNELLETDRRNGLKIFLAQLQSSLVLLLFAAMVVSVALGEFSDAVAVLAIIVLNTLLGFWQDFQAEKSLAELKKLSVPEVVARRDGVTKNIQAGELVPGDVVILQAGYFVPADCRLIELNDLATDESALTGESMPVDKTIDKLEQPDLPIGDRTNLGFTGTMVVRGHGVAVVTATGMNTQLGEIAGSLQSVESEPTPLQIRLSQLSRSLALLVIVIVILVFVAGLIAGQSAKLMLMTALSLAVAAVPEGLPAVATVALAIGARRMFKRNALIRQLPAVETLGSVSVICSDKTGTLTQNKMTASILDVADHQIQLEDRRNLMTQLKLQSATTDQNSFLSQSSSIQLLLVAGCLCNDAQLHQNHGSDGKAGSLTKQKNDTAVGEPTEKALVEVAARFGVNQLEFQSDFPRTGEIAFSSERKRMTTLHSVNRNQTESLPNTVSRLLNCEQVAFAKGSVDSMLDISNRIWVDDQPEALTDHWRQRIEDSCDEMAAQGTRVLAIGFRPVEKELPLEQIENDIIFVGLVGISDPPRPEAKNAVERCRRAGIRPIMITGDHPLTAMSIARELGISDGGSVVTGQELATMPIETLRDRVLDVSVFARVAPADKLHIVEALQHANEVVAMTGDGVNDAPALKQANVGVAMGQTGTDVSKQAANMVLLDDNFATIVAAVEQGRIVYNNVRKFVRYTMSSNVGEILVMTLGVLMGMPLPLLPLQILWVNLVTDGLPGLALAVEPVEKNTMNRPPLAPDEPIFNRRMKIDVSWIGFLIGVLALVAGSVLASSESNVDHWRTIIFSVLTFSQMGNALACRSESPLLFGKNTQPNLYLWGAIATTCVLQLAVVYAPPLQAVFDTQALSLLELSACFVSGGLVYGLLESQKLVFSRWIQKM